MDGEFVRQTHCIEDPPRAEFVQSTTFEYSYEVIPDPNGIEDPATSGRFVYMLTDKMHDSLVDEFFTCDYNRSSVWTLQSSLHHITDQECQQVNKNPNCLVMTATHRILAYDASVADTRSGIGSRRLSGALDELLKKSLQRRRLQTTSESFADNMIVFVDDSMASGDLNVNGVTLEMAFGSGEIVILTVPPAQTPTLAPWVSDTAAPSSFRPTINPSEGVNNTLEEEDSSGKSGLAAPYVATITVASCFVVLVVLMVFSRRRNRHQDDDAYIRKGNLSTVDQLYIDSPGTNGDGTVQLDSRGNPIIITTVNSDGDWEDPYTSWEDNFKTRSPSKRSRSRLGPLTSQDELDRSIEDEEDSILGSHRGDKSTTQRPYPMQDTVNL